MARVRSEGHVVRARLKRPSDDASFGQTEAGVEGTQVVARLALGVVNAYLLGEAGGPWVLVDAGTAGKAEKISLTLSAKRRRAARLAQEQTR